MLWLVKVYEKKKTRVGYANVRDNIPETQSSPHALEYCGAASDVDISLNGPTFP